MSKIISFSYFFLHIKLHFPFFLLFLSFSSIGWRLRWWSTCYLRFFSWLLDQVIYLKLREIKISVVTIWANSQNSNCFNHGRRKVHDYLLLLVWKSLIWFTEQHIFKVIIYLFNTSKCAANYVISFEVHDDFIGQKTLKLWRQKIWPFSSGWAAHLTSIRSWTFHHPWFSIKMVMGKILSKSVVILWNYSACNNNKLFSAWDKSHDPGAKWSKHRRHVDHLNVRLVSSFKSSSKSSLTLVPSLADVSTYLHFHICCKKIGQY